MNQEDENELEEAIFAFSTGDDEMAELGYFSLKELQELKSSFYLGVERDKFWDDETTLDQVMNFQVR